MEPKMTFLFLHDSEPTPFVSKTKCVWTVSESHLASTKQLTRFPCTMTCGEIKDMGKVYFFSIIQWGGGGCKSRFIVVHTGDNEVIDK